MCISPCASLTLAVSEAFLADVAQRAKPDQRQNRRRLSRATATAQGRAGGVAGHGSTF
jgi:hypothetical protein